jgi:uncharacterized cupredoxin-like copper-binding protein
MLADMTFGFETLVMAATFSSHRFMRSTSLADMTFGFEIAVMAATFSSRWCQGCWRT